VQTRIVITASTGTQTDSHFFKWRRIKTPDPIEPKSTRIAPMACYTPPR